MCATTMNLRRLASSGNTTAEHTRSDCGVLFNAGNTPIQGEPGRVSLDQGDEHFSASSPEELILQQLGYELPVSYLEFWIKGLPVPDRPAALFFNELNQLKAFKQAEWTVSLSDLRDYGDLALPRRVDIMSSENDAQLRFIGLRWTLPENRGSAH